MYKKENVITELRKSKGLTQKELADLVGVSNAAISIWEKSTSNMSPKSIRKVCSRFNLKNSDFLKGDIVEKDLFLNEPLHKRKANDINKSEIRAMLKQIYFSLDQIESLLK